MTYILHTMFANGFSWLKTIVCKLKFHWSLFWRIHLTLSEQIFIPPLHRGCNLCASLVRPQNWPGCPWRQKGGRTVALVVQGWHIGRSDIAMDAIVPGKIWACSKQSHKGRRGGRSLKGGRMKAHTSPWSQNGCTVVGHWRHVCLPCTTIVPPLADQWRPLSDYCGNHCASIQRPRNTWATMAMVLPSLCLLCATCCATTAVLVVQGRHKGRAAAVTQKQNLGSSYHWAS